MTIFFVNKFRSKNSYKTYQVHYKTLSKVKLFQDCDTGLLKELVVKLRPIIFLPGDYICRKDDIGREMYIVQSGFVMVLGGNDGKTCLVTLGEGSVFGEIALLGVGGMNRRTADVVSKGFSNLFTLRKEDLEETLKHYPDAKRILNAKARKLMKENDERNAKEGQESRYKDKVLFRRSPRKDPALLGAVMRMVPTNSMTNMYLKHGSRAGSISLAADSSLYISRFDPCSVSSQSHRESYSSSSALRPRSASKESLTPFQEDSQNNQLSRRSSLATTTFGYVSDLIMQEEKDLQENEDDIWHETTEYDTKGFDTKTKKQLDTTSEILNVNENNIKAKSANGQERKISSSKKTSFKRQNRILSPECENFEKIE